MTVFSTYEDYRNFGIPSGYFWTFSIQVFQILIWQAFFRMGSQLKLFLSPYGWHFLLHHSSRLNKKSRQPKQSSTMETSVEKSPRCCYFREPWLTVQVLPTGSRPLQKCNGSTIWKFAADSLGIIIFSTSRKLFFELGKTNSCLFFLHEADRR